VHIHVQWFRLSDAITSSAAVQSHYVETPCVGPEHPLFPLFHSLPHLLLFFTFFSFPFLIHFNYFLLLSIPSLSTRVVPLRFEAGGRRK